jgi:integrase
MPRTVKAWGLQDLRNVSEGVHFVGGVGGLTLQVKASKSTEFNPAASWVLRVYVGPNRRNIGLGAYPEISLAEARRRALELKVLCGQGIDPVRLKHERRAKLEAEQNTNQSFKQIAEQYLATHESDYRNEKHRRQWKATLTTYAYPVLGHLPVRDINVEQVLRVLEPIWRDKTETAKRLQGRIEKVFDLAITSGIRDTNPARWKNFLSLRLPSPARVKQAAHYPSLPYQETARFMNALKSRTGVAAQALEFLILTAVRSGSVRKARWSEIDFKAREWRIPKENTKTHSHDHRVPLTDEMLHLLRSLPRRLDSDLVFPSPTGRMLSDMALNVLMRKMRTSGDLWVDAVPHGFRSTFRVWAAEATNYPSELAELCLMHEVGSTVYQAYQRSDLFEKRRQIMSDWNRVMFKKIDN